MVRYKWAFVFHEPTVPVNYKGPLVIVDKYYNNSHRTCLFSFSPFFLHSPIYSNCIAKCFDCYSFFNFFSFLSCLCPFLIAVFSLYFSSLAF